MKLEINDRLSGSGELELTRGSRANGTVEDIVLRADEGDELESLGRGEDLSLLLGQPFHRLTLEQALEECDKLVSLGGFWHVVTANTDFLAQSSRNQEAKSVLLGADRIFCDGMPLVWLSRLFAKGLPERVAGSDLTPKLLQRCAERGWGVFLFGTDEETMAVLKVRLAKLYPGLRLVGAIAPPYGRIEDWDNEAYVAEILAAKPSVFLAALGFPKQDIWINRYLKPSVSTLAVGVGASLDFLVGAQIRAPRWMQQCGIEWFWRMVGDPKRLVMRYVDDFVSLAGLVATQLNLQCLSAREVRSAPVGNGIAGAVERITVCDGCDREELRAQVLRSNQAAVVLDCAELYTPSLGLCCNLVELARSAQQVGKKVALYGAGRRINSYLAKFGLEDSLPIFEHPLALEAWVDKQTAIISDRIWRLRVPGNLTADRVKGFRACVREVVRRARAEGETIRLCLNEVNRTSVAAMIELARWCEEFEGKRDLIALSGGSAQLRETFRIIGLEEYLGEPEFETSRSPLGADARGASRAVTASTEIDDEEDLVLDGDSLWD